MNRKSDWKIGAPPLKQWKISPIYATAIEH